MAADLQALETTIGHAFRDRDLLVRALTHSSYSSEVKPSRSQPDNEQFEFFGDAVLGFLISENLVTRHPDFAEGQLSLAKSHLVSARWLHEVAIRIGLGEFLNLGRSEEQGGGRAKRSVLANAIEALIAALYFDGGIEAARRFVLQQIYEEPLRISAQSGALNFKGRLWERSGAEGLPKPEYCVIEESGPHHARHFVVEARLGTLFTGTGGGSSKKSAEQNAAKQIIDQLDRLQQPAQD